MLFFVKLNCSRFFLDSISLQCTLCFTKSLKNLNIFTKFYFILINAEWRLEELRQIDAELDGPERKAALCALLDQEAQLIASIGRHKYVASKENKEKNAEKFLGKVRCFRVRFSSKPEYLYLFLVSDMFL